jgi:hypothetical protein
MMKGFAVAGLLLVASSPQPKKAAPRPQPPPYATRSPASPIDCYNAGRDATLLNKDQILELCECARGPGPIECYNSARDSTMLSDQEIIRLCVGQHNVWYLCPR